MALTHAEGTGTTTHPDRDFDRDRGPVEDRTETRRAFKTTEFFVLLAGVAAVIIAGYASDDSLDMARIWTLVTVLVSAYMISRGLAKSGSSDSDRRHDGRRP